MIARSTIKQFVFDVSFVSWIVYYMFFGMSTFSDVIPFTVLSERLFLLIVCIGCAFIIVNSKFSKKELLIIMILFFVGILTALCTRSEAVVIMFLFFVATKYVDCEKTFRILFKAMLVSFILIIMLSLIGAIQNKGSYGNSIWDKRFYLGFKHPNYCGVILLNLILIRLINTKAKFRASDYLFSACLEIINLLGPKSKTNLLLGAIVIVGVFVFNFFNCKWLKTIILKIRYMPLLLTGFSIFAVYGYNTNKSWGHILNSFFSTRIEQMAFFWNNYNISLFGQVLENVSSAQSSTLMPMRALDNGYLYMLLGQGLLFTLTFWGIYVRSIKCFIMQKRYDKLMVLIIVLLQAMTEALLFRIEMNVVLLILAAGLYCESREERQLNG